MENSTVDSLKGPPEPERAKKGSRFAEAEILRMVGFVESSSLMALWSQADRMMIFMTIASRWRGISVSSSSGSYVVSSQVVFTPVSERVILSGEPDWRYCRVQERSRRREGAVKALEADEVGCCMLLVVDLDWAVEGESFMPNIFNVSKRAESEMTK